MRRRIFLLTALLILSSAFAIQTYADFANYKAERVANTSITSPPDAFIAFTCGNRLEVTAGESADGIATVITNKLDEPVEIDVEFYEWTGNPEDITLEVQAGSRSFTLLPHESENVWVTVAAGRDAVEGVYEGALKIYAKWDGGNANILTSPCPIGVKVNAPRQNIEKVLISGPTTVPLFTREEWELQIRLDTEFDDVEVTDVIPGEFDLVSYTPSRGSVTITPHGGSTHILWSPGSNGYSTLDITIATGLNPSGKREFTSSGRYKLNEGACIKGTSICTDPIYVVAYEEEHE